MAADTAPFVRFLTVGAPQLLTVKSWCLILDNCSETMPAPEVLVPLQPMCVHRMCRRVIQLVASVYIMCICICCMYWPFDTLLVKNVQEKYSCCFLFTLGHRERDG